MGRQKLAINGGEPVRDKPFPPHPMIGKEEINAAIKVLQSGKLSTFHLDFLGGEKVKEFEGNFSKYTKAEHAISVNSGTAALHVALASAGIGPGDEVIVPSYTFTATASSVLMHNSIPVFADVDPGTYNIDPSNVKAQISSKTKAIIPVHIFGNPVEMDEILEIADEKGLVVIEDCAQAPGAKYKKKHVGTLGHMGTFSFQETKTITTGEGGMVITNDENLAERARLVRNHGEAFVKGKPRSYLSNILGWNYRMTELEASIGVEQLKKLNKINETRIKNSKYLSKKLSKFGFIKPQFAAPYVKHVYSVYGMTYDDDALGISRNKFTEALIYEGIPVLNGYPHPLYMNPLFMEKIVYGKNGCPFTCKFYGREINYRTRLCKNAERLCDSSIWTYSIRPPATRRDMEDIVAAIEKICDNVNELKNK